MTSKKIMGQGPPDFTSSQQYSHRTSDSGDRGRPKSPMCIVPQNPSPSPKILPNIMTPLTPLDSAALSFPSKFLTIPLEIRLQIYPYVLLSHPVRHSHLAPAETTEGTESQQEFLTKFNRPLGRSEPTTLTTSRVLTVIPSSSAVDTNTTYPVSTPSTLIPRTQGKIPTALLASCSQIYEEARMLPWHENDFAFVNWFWSGVYAAKQFTRGLQPWQSNALRFAGVEVQGKFLKSDEKQCKDWKALCGLWRGLWELRLCVKGSVGTGLGVLDGSSSFNEEGASWEDDADAAVEQSGIILDVRQDWVSDGLAKMSSLRLIELEVEDVDVERGVKLEFCRELEGKLARENGGVQVVFVERVARLARQSCGENKGWRCD